MVDREKVIRGLECCKPMMTQYDLGACDACPYDRASTPECGICDCLYRLLTDALALLRAQEPRVLTLEEVMDAAGTPAYMEAKSGRSYTGWALIYDVQKGLGITGTRIGMTRPGYGTIWPSAALYGAKWRCWTGRPTEEQRKAVKWDAAD